MTVKLQLQNKIINGCFEYWQRGTSFAAVAHNTYIADRFRYQKSGTMIHTISRSTDVPASAFGQYSILADVTTVDASLIAGDYAQIIQPIEGNVLRSFKNKKIVLSFWVKATKIGTYCVSFRNSAVDRSLVKEFQVLQSNVWEKKIVRMQHDSSGSWLYDSGVGMFIGFTLAAGSTFLGSADSWQNGNITATINQVNSTDDIANNFQLADVCLVEDNEGATRDPEFQLAGRDLFEELQLCQRYYEVGTVASSGTASGTFSRWNAVFRVAKRAVPSVSYTIINGQNAAAAGVNGTDANGSYGNSNGGSLNDWTAWTFRADAEL